MIKCKHDCGKAYFCRYCGRQIKRTLAAPNWWSQFWQMMSEPYTAFGGLEESRMRIRNEYIDRGEAPPATTEAICINGRLSLREPDRN